MNNPIAFGGELDSDIAAMCGAGDCVDVGLGTYNGRDRNQAWRQICEELNLANMNTQHDIETSGAFSKNNDRVNTVMFHTMQLFKNPNTHRWEKTNANTCPFGDYLYPGARKVRDGHISMFKENCMQPIDL